MLSENPAMRRAWGVRSRELVDGWDLRASVEGVVRAVDAVV